MNDAFDKLVGLLMMGNAMEIDAVIKSMLLRADDRHAFEDLSVVDAKFKDNGGFTAVVSAVKPMAFYLVAVQKSGTVVVDTFDYSHKTVLDMG